MGTIFDNVVFTWVVLPILIFLARVIDVTLGTIRIVFISRGSRYLAPVLGFFEVFIWLLAIRQVLANLSNIFCYIGYAAGFAMGNYIGIILDEKLAVGRLVLRIITQKDADQLLDSLRRKGFGVTQVPAEGSRGKVILVYTVINRRDLERAIRSIDKYNPNAFYTIENVRMVREGVFPQQKSVVKQFFPKAPKIYRRLRLYRHLLLRRKGK
ncbi:DUF2179 domain-containing protein [bacterium]|nr:DUF2179 domain-containing protein [bacterium]